MADGNSLPGCSSSDLCRAAAQHQLAQRRAVGSELVGHDGSWSDALLLQEFSHQLERRLAVSPWLNEDVQDLAASLSTARQTYNCLPLMETNTSSRCHRPCGRGRPRLSLRAMIPPNFKAQRR